MNCSPPGSSIHGILQTRIMEWVAISFSRGSLQLMDQTCIFCKSPVLQADSLPLRLLGILLRMYICTYVHVYVCIYIYTHIYVHMVTAAMKLKDAYSLEGKL